MERYETWTGLKWIPLSAWTIQLRIAGDGGKYDKGYLQDDKTGILKKI